MPTAAGTRTFGPQDAELLVHTGRSGAAARAGHDLVIEVTSWEGTLALEEDPGRSALSLTADGGSFRVREGHGGIQSLGEDDKASIKETVDDEILKRTPITFRSTRISTGAEADQLEVEGELELLGRTGTISFPLTVDASGAVHAQATIKQSDWGIKPYSALFGTLKVADEVTVSVQSKP